MDSFGPADFHAAYDRIRAHIHQTPLMTSSSITERTGHQEVYFKCENLQKVGAFKIRGATNAVRATLEEMASNNELHRSLHFVTHSSGNHGQALALAARVAPHPNCKAHIVVPHTAPKAKVKGIAGYGATIHMCEPTLAAREAKCAAVEAEVKNHDPTAKVVFVHPFDNQHVIRGQGTLAIEMIDQFRELNNKKQSSSCGDDGNKQQRLEALVVPCGGGGMLSGIATYIKAVHPNIKVFGVEPIAANDCARGLKAGTRQTIHTGNVATPKTVADGLMTFTSDRTFGLIQQNVDGIIEVSEDQIKEAFQFFYERMKIVIEPSSATGVAAVMLAKDERLSAVKGAVAVVLSGGNVDFDKISTLSPSKL